MTAATNAPQPNYTAGDVLAYAAAFVCETTSWATDAIIGHPDLPSHLADELEDAANAIDDLSDKLQALAVEYGHTPGVYSDGRPTMTGATLAPGYGYSHLWHFDATKDEPHIIEPGPSRGTRVVVHIRPPSQLFVENVVTLAVANEAAPDPDNAA